MKRSLVIAAAILVGFVVFAYGFAVTQVDLTELGSPTRQESLARILRALARPDFIEFEQEQYVVEAPIYVPCPATGAPEAPVAPAGEPRLVVTPPCAEPRAEITVEGFDFAPNTTGPLNFIPPSGVSLQLGQIETDANGYFRMTVRLRDRTSDEPQLLRAVTRRNVGQPRLSRNGIDTINKIVETVFMALLATALGTLLAIPISFFAAQNLMRMVTGTLPSVALSILALPIGLWLGATVVGWIGALSLALTSSLGLNVGAVIATPLVILGVMRWAIPGEEKPATSLVARAMRWAVLGLALLGGILALYLVSDLTVALGEALTPVLGAFAFIGDFIAKLGLIVRGLLAPAGALVAAGALSSPAGKLGQTLVERTSPQVAPAINLALGAAAGATVVALLGAAVEWFYQLRNPTLTLYWPAAIGAAGGAALAIRYPFYASLPIGLAIYTVTRTVLNALRSIEALIMVIVFAVWVGIGPFAGVLALGLHTVASLAKLYSEQVESIAPGPLEAILATGANRLQMIVYAVIPQIVPPYISFTMYRWDINVRMSTIIGFAGGGGIGFLLQQNINLLNYRAASAQILAIAIVVSLMDYLSSELRSRTV
ncbi:MAG TPA: ABC transporter permease subunit [Caldilineaceae bacterium]|nr:ABC transporter permease subunit [Caldilineaceae bacterium]